MEQYWKACPTTSCTVSTEPLDNVARLNDESILSEFDRHRLSLLSSQNIEEGWQSEMCRYLEGSTSQCHKGC